MAQQYFVSIVGPHLPELAAAVEQAVLRRAGHRTVDIVEHHRVVALAEEADVPVGGHVLLQRQLWAELLAGQGKHSLLVGQRTHLRAIVGA